MTDSPLLSLRHVTKRRASAGTTFELRVDALELAPGERAALVGESGSGKSTLLDLVALASRPDSADGFRIEADGEASDIAGLWRDGAADALAALRARHVGYVPQTGGLFAFLNVFDNIDLPRRLLALP
ncbi:MAG: ATP-binding cassette domain-containing protein, partial [Alphaproteobacteria bacterium]|nr:ATP-binding cassette domain-containing protein [Alphaproteobacteria bacterium]